MASVRNPHSQDVDTASETESIPYDEELNGVQPPITSLQHQQQPQPAGPDPYSFAGRFVSTAAAGLATSFAQGLCMWNTYTQI